MRSIEGVRALATLVGEELAVSDWVLVNQDRIQQFADATGDHQWIHLDVGRAKEGPFGATIAHGFLSLSMLPLLTKPSIAVTGLRMQLNYGLNSVRWPSPLRVGSRVRDRITLLSVTPRGEAWQVVMRHQVEIENLDRPACVAEWITLMFE
jgi:acyl dehydratase